MALITGTLSAAFRTWMTSFGRHRNPQVPNSRVTAFAHDVEQGNFPMRIDASFTRKQEVVDPQKERYPEA
jgi:hypothetical protein